LYTLADAADDAVDLYNSTTGAWSTAQLSVARWWLAATSVGNVAVFAGGFTSAENNANSDAVDLYNITTGMWSTARLSLERGWLAAASVGNVAIFAGGCNASSELRTGV
jgi:hypothetical protein